MPDNYFDEQVRCANYWGAHLEEWKQNGGGVQASLRDTKRQILQDDESYFAKLIRKAWRYQEHSRDKPKLELGQWPVPDEVYREAAFALLQAQSALDGQCKSGASLVPLFWRELTRNGEVLRLDEMPEDLPMTSPTVAHWLKFWLLYPAGVAQEQRDIWEQAGKGSRPSRL